MIRMHRQLCLTTAAQGVVAIEAALLFSILIPLIAAIFNFGFGLYEQAALTEGVEHAARAATNSRVRLEERCTLARRLLDTTLSTKGFNPLDYSLQCLGGTIEIGPATQPLDVIKISARRTSHRAFFVLPGISYIPSASSIFAREPLIGGDIIRVNDLSFDTPV